MSRTRANTLSRDAPLDASLHPQANKRAPDMSQSIQSRSYLSSVRLRGAVSAFEPLFEANPKHIVFEDFDGYTEYQTQISLRNKDVVARRVKILSIDHPAFTLSAPRLKGVFSKPTSLEATTLGQSDSASKLAPGMEVVYTLTFKPHAKQDYSIDLVVVTERESFVIPVRAIGLRPKVDVPSHLTFGEAPVKYSTTRSMLIRNVGEKPAQFTFLQPEGVESPFSFQPSTGILAVGQMTQVLCTFRPTVTGHHSANIICRLDDSVDMSCTVEGTAVETDIRIQSEVHVPPTYLHMQSYQTFTITNKSDIPIQFAWRRDPSVQAERMRCEAELAELDERFETDMRALYVQRTLPSTLRNNTEQTDAHNQGQREHQQQASGNKRSQVESDLNESDSDMDLNTSEESKVSTVPATDQGSDREMGSVTSEPEDQENSLPDEELLTLETMDEEAMIETIRRQQELARRYRAERIALLDKLCTFADPIFEIEPQVGEIYPHGTMEITVSFKPTHAQHYSVTTYCEVTGRVDRIPVTLSSFGVGPKAVFSFETLDIGDVFIHAVHHYSVSLRNVGDIVAKFALKQNSASARLTFTPDSGTLGVSPSNPFAPHTAASKSNHKETPLNPEMRYLAESDNDPESNTSNGDAELSDSVDIHITFTSQHIGDFVERTEWYLEGSSEPLYLTFKGRVVGPSFSFDSKFLDFGPVCYGFLNVRQLTLRNTSKVPMKYRLRVPQDQHANVVAEASGAVTQDALVAQDFDPESRQFTISPATAVILPNSEQVITIEFVPHAVGYYHDPAKSQPWMQDASGSSILAAETALTAALRNGSNARVVDSMVSSQPYQLVVDVMGVGEAVQSVPIFAQSVVVYPTVLATSLDFGNCFLRYPSVAQLPLRNDHPLDAKLEVLPQDDASRQTAELQGTRSLAIAPNSQTTLTLAVRASKLGPFSFPIYLRIPGGSAPPIHVLATGVGVGPTVHPEPAAINFGSVPVLLPQQLTVSLVNTSPIAAVYKAVFQKPKSVYSVDRPEGVIEPNTTLDLVITATLDEALLMSDTLLVLIEDSSPLSIPIKAKGVGATCDPETPIDLIDFGDVFTHTTTTRTFKLINRGRRTQTLQWLKIPTEAELEMAERAMLAATGGTQAMATARSSPLSTTSKSSTIKGSSPSSSTPQTDEAEVDGQAEAVSSVTSAAVNTSTASSRLVTLDGPMLKKIKALADYIPSTCKITPGKVTLAPNMGMEFTLTAFSTKAGAVTEQLLCRALIGKNKDYEDIHNCVFKCNFVQPKVDCNLPSISFLARLGPNEVPNPTQQDLVLRNSCPLPLKFSVSVPYPFTCSESRVELSPGESKTATISFDPTTKLDRQSAKIQASLTLNHESHPAVDVIPVSATYCFPNLSFDRDVIDFGCILNESTKRMTLRMTNTSNSVVQYRWLFVDDPILASGIPYAVARGEPVGSVVAAIVAASESATQSSGVLSAPHSRRSSISSAVLGPAALPYMVSAVQSGTRVPLETRDVVAVSPLHGELAPGQSEQVEVILYGRQHLRVRTSMVCQVVGGPEYEIGILGETSQLTFKIDRRAVHLGARELEALAQGEVVLHNSGRVPLDFAIDRSLLNPLLAPLITFSPTTGRLNSGERAKINVNYKVLLPSEIFEQFAINVGCFDPIVMPITALGHFPQVLISDLPRIPTKAFQEALVLATQIVAERKVRLQREAEVEEAEAAASLGSPSTAAPNLAAEPQVFSAGSVDTYGIDTTALGGELSPAAGQRNLGNRLSSSVASSPTSGTTLARGGANPMILGNPIPTQPARYSFPTLPPEVLRENATVYEELEAERLIYCEQIKQALESRLSQSPMLEVLDDDESQGTSTQAAIKPSPSTSALSNAASITQNHIVAEYSLDFGHIMVGRVKSKTFTLTNASNIPVSWELPKDMLTRSLFTIEPTYVSRLAPGTSRTITVTCSAIPNPKKGVKEADLVRQETVVLPLSLRGGPQVRVHISANVILPSMQLSSKAVDFEKVYLGFRKEITIQLHNQKQVPCEWVAKSLVGLGQKERTMFSVTPSSGILQPDGRQNVVISFKPTMLGKFSAQIPIKIQHNPTPLILRIKGEAANMELFVTPSELAFKPVQPDVKSEPIAITITNPNDCDIEIYNVELDPQYVEEEKILIDDDKYDESGILELSPPRMPGDQLPLTVLRRYHRRMRQKQLREQEQKEKELAAASGAQSEEAKAEVTADAQDSSAGDQTEEQDTPVHNILIIGPPFAGSSTVAKALAEEHRLNIAHAVVTLDSAISWLCNIDARAEERAHNRDLREKERAKRAAQKKKSVPPMIPGAPPSGAVAGGETDKMSKADRAQLAEEQRMIEEEMYDLAQAAMWTSEEYALAAEVRGRIIRARNMEGEFADPNVAAGGKASARGTQGGAVAGATGVSAGASANQKKPAPGTTASAAGNSSTSTVASMTAALVGSGDELDEDPYHDFSDLRGRVDVLPEELLVRAFRAFILQKQQKHFERGIIIDGLESAFTDRVGAARVIRAAFSSIALVRDNLLQVVVLGVTPVEALRRASNLGHECRSIVEDKELVAQLKRFKPLAEKEVARLTDDKRQKYEDLLVLSLQRKKAETTLRRLATLEYDRLKAFYGDSLGDIEEFKIAISDAAAAGAAVLAGAAPPAASGGVALGTPNAGSQNGPALSGKARTPGNQQPVTRARSTSTSGLLPLNLGPGSAAPSPTHAEGHTESASGTDSSSASSEESSKDGPKRHDQFLQELLTVFGLGDCTFPELQPQQYPQLCLETADAAGALGDFLATAQIQDQKAQEALNHEQERLIANDAQENCLVFNHSVAISEVTSAAGVHGGSSVSAALNNPEALATAASFVTSNPSLFPWAKTECTLPVLSPSWIQISWFNALSPLEGLIERIHSVLKGTIQLEDLSQKQTSDANIIPPTRLIQLLRRPLVRPPAIKPDGFFFVVPRELVQSQPTATGSEADISQPTLSPGRSSPPSNAHRKSVVAAPVPSPSPASAVAATTTATTAGEGGVTQFATTSVDGALQESTIAPDTSATRQVVYEPAKQTRWIIRAHESIQVYVQFASPNLGSYSYTFGFENMLRPHETSQVTLHAVCAVPGIVTDPKVVYNKKSARLVYAALKNNQVPQAPVSPGVTIANEDGNTPPPSAAAIATPAQTTTTSDAATSSNASQSSGNQGAASTTRAVHAYIPTEKVFEFGPLLIGKDISMVIPAGMSGVPKSLTTSPVTTTAPTTQPMEQPTQPVPSAEELERMQLVERDEMAFQAAAQLLATQLVTAFMAANPNALIQASGTGAQATTARGTGGLSTLKSSASPAPTATVTLSNLGTTRGSTPSGAGQTTSRGLVSRAAGSATTGSAPVAAPEAGTTITSPIPNGLQAFAKSPFAAAVANAFAAVTQGSGVTQATLIQNLTAALVSVAKEQTSKMPAQQLDPLGLRLPGAFPPTLIKTAMNYLTEASHSLSLGLVPNATCNSSGFPADRVPTSGIAPSTAATDVMTVTRRKADGAAATCSAGSAWKTQRSQLIQALNSEVFHIANSSPFPITVTCAMKYRVNSNGQLNTELEAMQQEAEARKMTTGSRGKGAASALLAGGMGVGGANAKALGAPNTARAGAAGLNTGLPGSKSSAQSNAGQNEDSSGTALQHFSARPVRPRNRLSALDIHGRGGASSMSAGNSASTASLFAGVGTSGASATLTPSLSTAALTAQSSQPSSSASSTSRPNQRNAPTTGLALPPAASQATVTNQANRDLQAEEDSRLEQLRAADVFTCDASTFTLGVGESKDVTVWAFPQTSGIFYDELCISVADSPNQVIFPVRCEGVDPRLILSTTEIDFDRLLLGQVATATLEILNPNPIPVAWSLRQWDLMVATKAFAIKSPTSGVIPPLGVASVVFEYRAMDLTLYDFRLELDLRDTERARPVIDTYPLVIRGSATKIDAVVSITEETGIDFKTLRVGDEGNLKFTLTNQGRNAVKFDLSMNPQSKLSQVVTITPDSGQVPAGQSITFHCSAKSAKELAVHLAQDFVLQLEDAQIPNVCGPIAVPEKTLESSASVAQLTSSSGPSASATQAAGSSQRVEGGRRAVGSATGGAAAANSNGPMGGSLGGAAEIDAYGQLPQLSPPVVTIVTPAKPATLTIPVSVKFVKAKFRTLPVSGIVFGPTESGATRTAKFKILNDGVFPVQFHVFAKDAAHPHSRKAFQSRGSGPMETPATGTSASDSSSVAALRRGSQLAPLTMSGADLATARTVPPVAPPTPSGGGRSNVGAALTTGMRPRRPNPGAPTTNQTDKSSQEVSSLQTPDVLEIGPFTVTPISGLVGPSGATEITVTLRSEEPGSFVDYIELVVNDYYEPPADTSVGGPRSSVTQIGSALPLPLPQAPRLNLAQSTFAGTAAGGNTHTTTGILQGLWSPMYAATNSTSHTACLVYEICGEVCGQGIETKAFQSIFEEQEIITRAEDSTQYLTPATQAVSQGYAPPKIHIHELDDKLPHGGKQPGSASSKHSELMREPRDVFIVSEQALVFAPVIVARQTAVPHNDRTDDYDGRETDECVSLGQSVDSVKDGEASSDAAPATESSANVSPSPTRKSSQQSIAQSQSSAHLLGSAKGGAKGAPSGASAQSSMTNAPLYEWASRTQRVRILNPFKVACTVNLKIWSTQQWAANLQKQQFEEQSGQGIQTLSMTTPTSNGAHSVRSSASNASLIHGGTGATKSAAPTTTNSSAPTSVRRAGGAAAGHTGASAVSGADAATLGSAELAFTLSHSTLQIPPHESRFVSITFTPTALQTYSAIFQASVAKAADVSARELVFELRGEGILPALTVSAPQSRDPGSGAPIVSFSRVFTGPAKDIGGSGPIGQSYAQPAKSPIILSNDGKIPATVRFDLFGVMPASTEETPMPSTLTPALAMALEMGNTPSIPASSVPSSILSGPLTATASSVVGTPSLVPAALSRAAFNFSGLGRLVTVLPGQSVELPATFLPRVPGLHVAVLKMTTLENQFDSTTFYLRGEGYAENVSLEGLTLTRLTPTQLAQLATYAELVGSAHVQSSDAKESSRRSTGKAANPAPLTNTALTASTAANAVGSVTQLDGNALGVPTGTIEEIREELSFGDVAIGCSVTKKITLRNHTGMTYRFQFAPPSWDKQDTATSTTVSSTARKASANGSGQQGFTSRVPPVSLSAMSGAMHGSDEASTARGITTARQQQVQDSVAAQPGSAVQLVTPANSLVSNDWTITPAIGHLPAYGSKTISVTFRATGRRLLPSGAPVAMKCQLQPIKHVWPLTPRNVLTASNEKLLSHAFTGELIGILAQSVGFQPAFEAIQQELESGGVTSGQASASTSAAGPASAGAAAINDAPRRRGPSGPSSGTSNALNNRARGSGNDASNSQDASAQESLKLQQQAIETFFASPTQLSVWYEKDLEANQSHPSIEWDNSLTRTRMIPSDVYAYVASLATDSLPSASNDSADADAETEARSTTTTSRGAGLSNKRNSTDRTNTQLTQTATPATENAQNAQLHQKMITLGVHPQAQALGPPLSNGMIMVAEPLPEPLYVLCNSEGVPIPASERQAPGSAQGTSVPHRGTRPGGNSATPTPNNFGSASGSLGSANTLASANAAGSGIAMSTSVSSPIEYLTIPVSVTCDRPSYELDIPNNDRISFAPTMMFQSRTWSFQMRNTSTIALDYEWKLAPVNASRSVASAARGANSIAQVLEERMQQEAFSISPEKGLIPPGGSTTFNVTFSPLESTEFTSVLEAIIPHLDAGATATGLVLPALIPNTASVPQAPQQPVVNPATAPPQSPPRFILVGTALRPKIHFDMTGVLEPGVSAVDAAVHNATLLASSALVQSGAAGDPNIKLIEFSSLGTGVRNTKRFSVVNPTNIPYSFIWSCESTTSSAAISNLSSHDALPSEPAIIDPSSNKLPPLHSQDPSPSGSCGAQGIRRSPFECMTKSGVIQCGRRFEMVFEFTPSVSGHAEALYRFFVPELGLSLPFLLVGDVVEPRIWTDRARVDFKSMIVGQQTEEVVHLVNSEHMPFSFKLDKLSLIPAITATSSASVSSEAGAPGASLDASNVLTVHPMQGVIPPGGRIPLTLRFRPDAESVYNYNLVFDVAKKPNKVLLNVKGEGFPIRVALGKRDAGTGTTFLEFIQTSDGVRLPCDSSIAAQSQPSASAAVSHGKTLILKHEAKVATIKSRTSLLSQAANPSASAQEAQWEKVVNPVNFVDFGLVSINDKAQQLLEVHNKSRVALDYQWSFPLGAPSCLTLEPMTGSIRRGSSQTFEVVVSSKKPQQLSTYAVLTVAKAVRYVVKIEAQIRKADVTFSFAQYDFGSHFVTTKQSTQSGASLQYATASLVVTNRESDKNVQVEAILDPSVLAQGSTVSASDITTELAGFSIEPYDTIIPPGQSVTIPIRFHPSAIRSYSLSLPFEINGLYRFPLQLTGEGIPFRVELQNPSQSIVNLGQLRPKETRTQSVVIENKSKIPVTFALLSRSRHTSGAASSLVASALTFSPPLGQLITLAPKATQMLNISFAPTARLPSFVEEISLDPTPSYTGSTALTASSSVGTAQHIRPLLTVKGACIDAGIALEVDRMVFGSVLAGSAKTLKNQLINTGDVACKFKIDPATVGPLFTITPMEGVIPAQDSKTLEVTFHPHPSPSAGTTGPKSFEVKRPGVLIYREGGTPAPPLTLALQGTVEEVFVPPLGSAQQEGASSANVTILQMVTKARTPVSESILIRNDTSSRWTLTPSFSSPLFTGQPSIDVPARGTATYTITYLPLTRTEPPSTAKPATASDTSPQPSSHTPTPVGATESKQNKPTGSSGSGPASQAPPPLTLNRVPVPPASHSNRRSSPTSTSKAEAANQEKSARNASNDPTLAAIAATRPRPTAHECTLFIPIPTGEALIYQLVGTALPPAPAPTISLTTQSKKTFSHVFTVKNWMACYQRFRVVLDVLQEPGTGIVADATALGDAESLGDPQPLSSTPNARTRPAVGGAAPTPSSGAQGLAARLATRRNLAAAAGGQGVPNAAAANGQQPAPGTDNQAQDAAEFPQNILSLFRPPAGVSAGADKATLGNVSATTPDGTITVSGAGTLDVPPNMERKYKFNISSYITGTCRVRVLLLNDELMEYAEHLFRVTFTEPASNAEAIPQLITPVRQLRSHTITIANPLPTTPLRITRFMCPQSLAIHVPNLPLTINPQSEGTVTVNFLPLVPHGPLSATLSLVSDVLGDFVYDLSLVATALPANSVSKTLSFQAALGGEMTQTVTFNSLAPAPVEYEVRVSGGSGHFSVVSAASSISTVEATPVPVGADDASDPASSTQAALVIPVPACAPGTAGVPFSITVRYEPSFVGSSHAFLSATSAVGGQYVCALHGACSPPKPQGPIVVRPGGAASLRFKNVLDVADTFYFSISHPGFTINKRSERLERKADTVLTITVANPASAVGAATAGKAKTQTVPATGTTSRPGTAVQASASTTGAANAVAAASGNAGSTVSGEADADAHTPAFDGQNVKLVVSSASSPNVWTYYIQLQS